MELETPSSARKAPVVAVKSRFSPYFIVAVLIIVLITGGFIFRNKLPLSIPKSNSKVELTYFNLDKVTYYDSSVKDQVSSHLQTALDEQKNNHEKSKDSLTKGFYLLKTDYTLMPQKEKRDAMVLVVNYAKESYEELGKILEPAIPCNQESCGAKFSLSEELTEFKTAVFDSPAISDNQKDVFVSNFNALEVATGSQDKDKQYFQLGSIFNNLKSIWQQEQDPQLEELMSTNLEFLQELDSERYKFEEEQGFFKIK